MLLEAYGIQKPFLVLQWHLTDYCDQHCQHCYMNRERAHSPFSLEEHYRIVDDFAEMTDQLRIRPKINFTGGDPLLHPLFWPILKYARSQNIAVRILGNPFHVNTFTVARLRRLGVEEYQLSVDGLEAMHDSLRQAGSFAHTREAIKRLVTDGFRVDVMYTASKRNAADFPDVVQLMADLGVFRFSFGRYVPFGQGADMKEDAFQPLEYRDFLLKIKQTYDQMLDQGCQTKFVVRDPLWTLLNYELGLFKPSRRKSSSIEAGCGLGISFVVLLSDGTVWACRRFESPIGYVLQDSFYDMFVNSEAVNSFREYEKMEKCRYCELIRYCRGCASAACARFGRWTAPDPQCWKKVNII